MRTPVPVTAVSLLILLAACGVEEAEPLPTPTVVPVPQPPTESAADAVPAETPTGGGSATSQPTAPATPPPTTSSPTTPSTTPPSPTATATEQATAQRQLNYFLQRESGNRPWVEPVTFSYDPNVVGDAVAREALTRLLAAPDQDGLTNPVPDGTRLLDVAVEDGLLRINLSAEVTDSFAGSPYEGNFQQMLAHTGAQFPTVDRVQVVIEGESLETLWGHVDWSQPFEPDPFALSPIIIEQADGSDGTIRLSGTANVFEATVELVLTDGAGAVVEETFATASCGTGCRGEWQATFDELPPGSYTVTAREPDPSDGEGFAPFEVAVPVEVS